MLSKDVNFKLSFSYSEPNRPIEVSICYDGDKINPLDASDDLSDRILTSIIK